MPVAKTCAALFRKEREQRFHELVGIEDGEIFGLLADADVLDRQAELLADRDHDATLRRAVELGEHDASATGSFGKSLGLADRVLARGGVEHKQYLVRSVRNQLGNYAANLREFAHQIRL